MKTGQTNHIVFDCIAFKLYRLYCLVLYLLFVFNEIKHLITIILFIWYDNGLYSYIIYILNDLCYFYNYYIGIYVVINLVFTFIYAFAFRYVVPKPRAECTKGEQLVVTFGAGYIAGVFCAIVSHPADTLVSKLNQAKGASAGDIVKKIGFMGECS